MTKNNENNKEYLRFFFFVITQYTSIFFLKISLKREPKVKRKKKQNKRTKYQKTKQRIQIWYFHHLKIITRVPAKTDAFKIRFTYLYNTNEQ